jgi:hypothetical protein
MWKMSLQDLTEPRLNQQREKHRSDMERAGNGCAVVTAIPGNRKNLFKIDWNKLV